MSSKSVEIADNFIGMINSLNDDVKLDLISKITDSLKKTRVQKDDSWKQLFGAFDSDQTADELVEEIRASRYSDRKIEEL